MPIFTQELHADLPVLVISGELDLSTQSGLHDALASIDSTAPAVMIDLCKCKYFDSSAIAEMIRFYKARSGRQQIMLSAPSETAQRILRITGLDRLIPMVECTHTHRWRLREERDDKRLRRHVRLVGEVPERFG